MSAITIKLILIKNIQLKAKERERTFGHAKILHMGRQLSVKLVLLYNAVFETPPDSHGFVS